MLQTGTLPMSPLGRGQRGPVDPGPPVASPTGLSSACSPKGKGDTVRPHIWSTAAAAAVQAPAHGG